ncbi:MAG: hypothetical protein LBL05_04665 [Synergistaceae bacterium]|nr:hypothetical protein [Synergistaceae bacterium]
MAGKSGKYEYIIFDGNCKYRGQKPLRRRPPSVIGSPFVFARGKRVITRTSVMEITVAVMLNTFNLETFPTDVYVWRRQS